MRRWRKNNPIKAIYAHLKDGAKRRHIFFDLTYEQLRDFVTENNYIEKRGSSPDALQIDRINYGEGYTYENIQILTCSENSTKGNYEKNNPF